jgi:uncharacterized protein (TIGR03437 family)
MSSRLPPEHRNFRSSTRFAQYKMKKPMLFRVLALIAAGCLLAGGATAQTLGNSSLTGKYYFVQLLVTAAGGAATEVRDLSGSITFDGNGAYAFTGNQGAGAGAPGALSGNGVYAVNTAGDVTLTNPLRNTLQINGRLGDGAAVVLGASTEAADNTNDLFVAIRAPGANVTNAVLSGAYTGASLQLPSGNSAAIRSVLVSLTANGSGQFTRATAVGHAADQNAGRNASQEATGATYNINGDGTGTASFGTASTLFSGARDIFVSQDGNYVIGTSNASGGREIFVAAKNFSASATPAAFEGRYWIAEMIIFDGSFSSASGALRAGNGRATIAQRLHQDTVPLDFTTVNFYSVNPDSTGTLGPFAGQTAPNMALGVAVNVDGVQRPHTLVSAQVGAVNAATTEYGVSLLVRAPRFTSTGAVFLDPTGVVSNASRAPTPNPLAPGSIVELYGSNLAPRVGQPSALPLPATLEGVSVTVNGQAAPLFYVSPGQINIQVPFEVSGSRATVQVNNGGTVSNEVPIPLSPSSPGVYSYADGQSPNRAIILHSDGVTLVTPQNPARTGEIVVIYATGLGALNPAVPSGAGNPASPLARATDPLIQVLFGGAVATNVTFVGGAPFFAGLNQINVAIPGDSPRGTNVPVAIASTNAYTDLTDIPIEF